MSGKRAVPVAVDPPLGALLTVPQAARRLGMSAKRLRRNIAERRIQVLRDGRQVGIYAAWCHEFVRRCTVPVSDVPPPKKRLADLLPKPGEERFLRLRSAACR